ncbi:MAG: polymorphic toxin-type HINT domain-containing protein, partial [Oscillospiraceae bacterium]|nr:polymorphic toxin-type HINT domain-containing protein [Oscillospiraceae bacterium]
AVHLRAGDILVLVNGEYVVVEKVQHEILEAPITVYNFQVEDYHTYFVTNAGVLVHNTCKPTSPVKLKDNALKGVDAHTFKAEFVGKNVAHWDIFKDTANDSLLWLGNKAQTVWQNTGYYLTELIEMFPK